jgi:hypothetical protein
MLMSVALASGHADKYLILPMPFTTFVKMIDMKMVFNLGREDKILSMSRDLPLHHLDNLTHTTYLEGIQRTYGSHKPVSCAFCLIR